ncbi:sigma 54-interacting transcriptional regulator [Clostridium botulinum]|uniref:sigma-54 interaction domain-containing protein n=1 Tax=Clostridium botulinum TaxID=1491 RepID=UPI000585FF9D|nr:sigma 54-interacting transcriptional regulator [Clostridium botulinum]AJD25731.1 AAA domain family protein [Clostridium botulinum CDC_297]MBY6877603.1 sigma 54-interacting transcriptional regulator [Clostridium botulinum]MBY6892673.1 sigma 54-interacting transcriptional regulator [Clostridium botulinum]MBY6896634.1 sigma 54-interacting transcriptional regulator [Clostridium botulinum]MBY6903832.1 sigma 54-interacting transcriptional regulator [Clostridium botulinum]
MFMEEDFKIISENINKCTININNKNNVLSDKYLLRNKSNNKHVDILKNKETHKKINKNSKVESKISINESECVTTIDYKLYNEMKKDIKYYKSVLDVVNKVLYTINECIVVVDENGIIIMMSECYKKFVNCKDPEGKYVEDVIKDTMLQRVLKTGNIEIGEVQKINGKQVITMRIPMKKEGRIIGAIGKIMFKDMNEFYFLYRKLNKSENTHKCYDNKSEKNRRAKYFFKDIVGDSSESNNTKSLAKKSANTNSNVLIVGESGTGKELYAHSIHNASNRRLGPFIKVNCGAIPAELLESELFGYEDGAFTGAKKGGKKGKFELANGGTIFLDEIGDMPMCMQVKLLRVIQEREVEKVGGNILKKIDVRIIAATNKNLEKLVEKNKFREDLYYRLNVIRINVPSLRERKEDILLISDSLVKKVSHRLGICIKGISKEAKEYLYNYNWPGNIRELENVIERSANLLDSDFVIKPKHLPKEILKSYIVKAPTKENKYLKDIISEVEKEIICNCLEKNKGNKNKTSKILGISRANLYKKISEYNII